MNHCPVIGCMRDTDVRPTREVNSNISLLLQRGVHKIYPSFKVEQTNHCMMWKVFLKQTHTWNMKVLLIQKLWSRLKFSQIKVFVTDWENEFKCPHTFAKARNKTWAPVETGALLVLLNNLWEWVSIVCLMSQLTIFQLYMWQHIIDKKTDWQSTNTKRDFYSDVYTILNQI